MIGTRVTPLLAARIERGIELLHSNPGAVLIMSGGQGPGEDPIIKSVSPEPLED